MHLLNCLQKYQSIGAVRAELYVAFKWCPGKRLDLCMAPVGQRNRSAASTSRIVVDYGESSGESVITVNPHHGPGLRAGRTSGQNGPRALNDRQVHLALDWRRVPKVGWAACAVGSTSA